MISRPTDIFFLLGIVCSQTAAILFGLSQGQKPDPMLCWLMFELGCLAGGIVLSALPRQHSRSHFTSARRVLAQTIFAGLGWWTAAYTPVVSNLVLPATICINLWLAPPAKEADGPTRSTKQLLLNDRELATLMLGLAVLSEMPSLSYIGLVGIAQTVILLVSWSVCERRDRRRTQSRHWFHANRLFRCVPRIAAAAMAFGFTAYKSDGDLALSLAAAHSPQMVLVIAAGFIAALITAFASEKEALGKPSSMLAARALTIIGILLIETCFGATPLDESIPIGGTPTFISRAEHLTAIIIAIWILARKS